MKTTLALMLALAAPQSCDPTALEGAEIRPGDGGVWLGGQDGGVFVATADPIDFKNRPMPSDELLCMLFVGDLNNTTNYEDLPGTWIEDITAPWFLGPTEPGADTRDNENAQLRYTYCDPTSEANDCSETINLILQFETIVAYTPGPGPKWDPYPQPYFLNGITAHGLDRVQRMRGGKAPTCWDWIRRRTEEFGHTPCPECAQLGREYKKCHRSDGEYWQCFANHAE